MNRNNFIKAFLGLGALLTSPFAFALNTNHSKRIGNGFLVKAGEDRFGKALAPFDGDHFFTKVSTRDTDGDLYVFESTRQEEGGPPLHYHYDQDEMWFILEGDFLVKVGDKIYEAKPGDTVFGPRGIPHTFAKLGEKPGRLIMLFQPAGKMEECFRKISEGYTKNMTVEQRDNFRKEHGFERVGGPLTKLKQ